MSFGEILKNLRKTKNIKQIELAKKLEIDRSTIGKWENNCCTPDFNKLLKLSSYFNVSTDYLLGKTEKNYFKNNTYKYKSIIDYLDDMTIEEKSKLVEYADFLKTQRKK